MHSCSAFPLFIKIIAHEIGNALPGIRDQMLPILLASTSIPELLDIIMDRKDVRLLINALYFVKRKYRPNLVLHFQAQVCVCLPHPGQD